MRGNCFSYFVFIKMLIFALEYRSVQSQKFGIRHKEKCLDNYPIIETSPELIPVDNRPNHYTVQPGAKTFSLNCSSTDPVLWDVKTKSVTKSHLIFI